MTIKLPKGFCKSCGRRTGGSGVWCDEHRPTTKYRNARVGGVDSRREAREGVRLANLQRAGVIRNLQAQVPYVFYVCGQRVAKYVADYTYETLENGVWTTVVVDVKGVRTAYYKLKARLFKAVLGYAIVEV